MPHKYFADQFDDEEVLFLFRKHPIVMRKALIFACAALLVGPVYTLIQIYTSATPPGMGFFLLSFVASFVLSALIMVPKWIGWHFSVYIVTDQRFIQISQKGLFHRSVVDMELRQIQMVNYEIAGLQQTMFGFGTIIMQTIVGDLVIHEVHRPATIQKKLLEILRKNGGGTAEAESAPEIDEATLYETED